MMQNIEPMTMSPVSPASPGAHGQNQFLPAYLMGEPAPMVTSPQNRLWSGSASSSSPPRAMLNKSYGTSPFVTSPSSGGVGGLSTSFGLGLNVSKNEPRMDPRADVNRAREMMGQRPKEKSGAPPVQGLLETIQSPVPTPDRKAEFCTPGRLGHYTPGTPAAAYQTPTPYMNTTGHDSQLFAQTRKTPPSPAQIDPFYTQGESIRPDDDLDETWITVFGFPPAATSFILQQFSQYGNIVKHIIATDGNWMHLHYQSKLQAKKALSKNGKIFGGSIMVGVTYCIDKIVMGTQKCDESSLIKTSFLGTPSQRLEQSMSERGGNISRHTPIRPLTAAYKAVHSDHEVIQGSNTPQKNANMLTKAVEYMFGW